MNHNWVLLLIVLISPLTYAANNGFTLRIESKLQSAEYPHILGAKISKGHVPETLIMASKTPHNINTRVDIRSATKSITALLFGAGNVANRQTLLERSVPELLPGYFLTNSMTDSLKNQITIEDLFTMRSGLACDDWVPASVGHEDKMYNSSDWIGFWSSKPMAHEPGKHFSYCTGNVIALGNVLTAKVGMPIPEFAEKQLFSKLGIVGAQWAKTAENGTDTGGHLKLGLLDLHKIGLLVLNKGIWQGQPVIAADWIAQISKQHTQVPERKETYGMLWWQLAIPVSSGTTTMIYAHGNGGNFIVIVPELQIVAAFTGDAYNARAQFEPLKLLIKEIIPQIERFDG